jgi:uridine kinase
VVLLLGPSGSGKSYLAASSGLPVVALDDFYRDGRDHDLPRLADGRVDWDDPGSWDGDAAFAALATLCRGDEVEVPTYAFGEDRAVGHRTLHRDGAPVVVAEGIFAGELIGPLRDAGLLADALLITENRWLTFGRRLARDLREGRKAPWYLVRQGWAKTLAEPRVVAHQQDLGGRCVTKAAARARLRELAGTPATAPATGSARAAGAA